MGEEEQRRRPRVLIAGGGVAALEAALALRDLAGDRLEVELWAPRGEFVYRPFGLDEPFGIAGILRYDLDVLARTIGARFRLGGIHAIDPEARQAIVGDGERVPYDHLLVCSGARMLWGVPGSVTFWGAADEGGVREVVRKLRAGALRDVVFTMSSGHGWVVPVYELALLAALVLARSGVEDARLVVVTPEDEPLQLFDPAAGARMVQLLDERGIEVVAGAEPVEYDGEWLRLVSGEPIETGTVVSLPRFEGRRIDGLPHDAKGFLPVDEHGRVAGMKDVFAAGDVTSFGVKQGGIAARGADAAAEAIAAAAGCELEPAPLDLDLSWSESDGKIASRYLTPLLR